MLTGTTTFTLGQTLDLTSLTSQKGKCTPIQGRMDMLVSRQKIMLHLQTLMEICGLERLMELHFIIRNLKRK